MLRSTFNSNTTNKTLRKKIIYIGSLKEVFSIYVTFLGHSSTNGYGTVVRPRENSPDDVTRLDFQLLSP